MGRALAGSMWLHVGGLNHSYDIKTVQVLLLDRPVFTDSTGSGLSKAELQAEA